MRALRKYECSSWAVHPICPSCLMPMHIRTAEVQDGHETIRFLCDHCGAEQVRDRLNADEDTVR
jgi:hypothetical protein